jgi:hypothetical protein
MPGFGAKAVESPQRKMNLLSIKKTGLGTPVISGSCASFVTVTDNGVGDYTINFTKFPFTQIPEIMIQPTTDNIIAKVGTLTALACQVLTENLSGAAAEGDFHLMAFGSLASDLVGV